MSSEIAQSRARFEKWATDNNLVGRLIGLEFAGGNYVAEALAKRWPIWQAAERDTRERCAQELEAEAKRLYATGIGSLMDGSATLENMAYSIRGKE